MHRPTHLRNPLAVAAFAGWGDAGEASTGAAEHLITALEGEAVARIDPDPFYEFQTRRPIAELAGDGTRIMHWPRNEFHVLHHHQRDLVVVLGEEPNLRWRSFCELVDQVLATLEVGEVITMGAFLGQVAHTLPVPLIGSALPSSWLLSHGLLPSGYEGPTGIVGTLTAHLAAAGRNTLSVWAAVPHYLANQNYPPAVHALVQKLSELGGLDLELGPLAVAADDFRLTVDAALSESKDVAEYVRRLEKAEDEPGETRLVDEIESFLRER
jgi:proteasome assembly chaperone (PAC2) family protein